MPLLTIENLPGARVEVLPGATLLAALQAAGHDWMHACGAKGRCTTCRLQVSAGLENLTPPTDAELRYRTAGRLLLHERLTCQARLLSGDVTGRVPAATQLPHVRYVDMDQ
ncbi:2Fe-2S iron-sulfur cluster-binding protein [Hymenobacter properus]|uniref:(2Fe-2S)-binding protein n=1 Tax=Hymenobacter properus TaxID=2791026 RepID=A0A931BJV2_9BACT|nr:2Fe-2S iron-sulfur cluster-binding protein [Hymenobacter properus]MBF9143871.1 (2Fe-2S)-binding protein [Hymenobacter properus]MBR7722685.1 (2Fe-2S)-binding protein [Microvirga sp. SRT04]